MSLRPSILDPLFAPANTLPGVGPKIAPLLDRLLGDAPLRQAMGDAAYRNVQRFSSAAVMARWQALFDGMLRARGARPLTPPAAPPCPSAE